MIPNSEEYQKVEVRPSCSRVPKIPNEPGTVRVSVYESGLWVWEEE